MTDTPETDALVASINSDTDIVRHEHDFCEMTIRDEGLGEKIRYWKPPTGVKISNQRNFGHFKKLYK